MGSMTNFQQAPALAQGNQQSQVKSFFIHILFIKQWKKQGNLGKFGQVWARQQKRKIGKKTERIRKENNNLSSDGEGEGESRVQNSPKAFGELKIICTLG